MGQATDVATLGCEPGPGSATPRPGRPVRWRLVRHRRERRLDDRVGQDHRRIGRRTRPCRGSGVFGVPARHTLADVEATAMPDEGQVRAAPAADVPCRHGGPSSAR